VRSQGERDVGQRGQAGLGGRAIGQLLLDGLGAVVGQSGPAQHRGQRQALQQQGHQNHSERDQDDEIAAGEP